MSCTKAFRWWAIMLCTTGDIDNMDMLDMGANYSFE